MRIAFLALFAAVSAHADCGLLEAFPHESTAILSNGAEVALPTQARKLASYVLFGKLDAAGAADRLTEGLVPLRFDGQALGALSVFDYQDSDLGTFRESYFVILAGREKQLSKPALYHLKAWSNSETAALASRELWGIPNQVGEIEIAGEGNRTDFRVRARELPVFEMSWGESPTLPNPFGYFLSVDAIGPGQGAPVTSPILTCGDSRISSFGAGDSLVVKDRSLDVLLKGLKFAPFAKASFVDQQAIQFPAN